MTWVLDEKYKLPIYLGDKEEMTKEEFLKFCTANSHLRIERDEDNEILIMPPVFGETGRKHVKIVSAIDIWNTETNAGVVFDSSTGFDLPDGSMRSPDASWVKKETWDRLSVKERNSFLPFAPDFVVEIFSASERLSHARQKMNKWIQNGTRLGWLIVPESEHTFVYKDDGTVDKITGFDRKVSGENVLQGFEFDLSVLK
jgi:Uma2 family endonuclease